MVKATRQSGRLKDEKPDDEETSAEELTSKSERQAFLKRSKRKLDGLNKDNEKLSAERKGNNEEINGVYRDLKTQLGMAREDAEYNLRLLSLDQDKRDKALDAQREFFETFGIAEQLNIFGKEKPAKRPTAEGTPAVN